MKKILLILAMVLFAVQAWGLTYYDKSADTTTSYETIAEMMAAKTMDDDDIIDLEGGTFLEGLVADGSGSFGHPAIIKGPGTITNSSGPGILIRRQSYINILNLTVDGCSSDGISVDTFSGSNDISNINITNVTSKNNGNKGISYLGYSPYKVSDSTILNCRTENNDGAGISVTQYVTDITVDSCTSNGDSVDASQWGIITAGKHLAVNSGWEPDSGTLYYRARTAAVAGIGPPQGSTITWLVDAGESPSSGEYWFDSDNSLLWVDVGVDPNTITLEIIEFFSDNIVFQNCNSLNTKDPTSNEGHGMGLEVGAKNCTIKNCMSTNNAGNGMSTMLGVSNSVIGNVINDNAKNGIGVQRQNGSVYYGNTVFNNTLAGITIFNSNTVTLKNNIIKNNTAYGLQKSTVTGTYSITNDYNCVDDFENISAGAHSITTNPRITSDSKLYYDSPCKASKNPGTAVAGVNGTGTTDLWGNAGRDGYIPMGAYFGSGVFPWPVKIGKDKGRVFRIGR